MPNNYLALDVGIKRIGVAAGDDETSIAFPLTTVVVDGSEMETIFNLCKERMVERVIVGYPRNQSGETTAQTKVAEEFAGRLQTAGITTEFQDESVTSIAAEEQLKLSKKPYQKADIDAQAAAVILTDFLEERRHA